MISPTVLKSGALLALEMLQTRKIAEINGLKDKVAILEKDNADLRKQVVELTAQLNERSNG